MLEIHLGVVADDPQQAGLVNSVSSGLALINLIHGSQFMVDGMTQVAASHPDALGNLAIALDALPPDETRAGSASLQIRYGIHATPWGDCLLATTDRGICNLHLLGAAQTEAVDQWLRPEWPAADLVLDQAGTGAMCDRIFTSAAEPIPLAVKGTAFQLQVWRALLQIPFGDRTTYQALAAAIGQPTAARAVGNAVGRNPVAYLIPCHRVVRASGELGGYRWGVGLKAALLAGESGE
jgi:AraC family transcriptional regulator of adaptative response/methylated-DNA-[protein]-cysteine methyltransferase